MAVIPATRPRLASQLESFEAWVGTRSSAFALFGIALAAFALQSIVLPVYPGRDMGRYVDTFVQLGYHVPILPSVLNTRGPLSALGVGVPLEIGGWAAEVWLGLLYAASIVAWGRVALYFGARAALLTTAPLLLYPGYGILFHQLASDSLFAAGFAGWAVLVAKAIERPSIRNFLFSGLAMGALVLVRPANQVLLVVALLPLVLSAPWRERLAWVASFVLGSAAVSQSWNAVAELRYGDAVILKPSKALLALALLLAPSLLPAPWRRRAALAVGVFVLAGLGVAASSGKSPTHDVRAATEGLSNHFTYRVFELDRLVSPDNGPASRRLARTVQRELLVKEPYRSYHVGVREFFASGSDRVFGDLTGVATPADLAGATREAIRRHPRKFTSSVAHTTASLLWSRLAAPEHVVPPTEQAAQREHVQYVVVDGRRLPRPSEKQPIPASAIGPGLWTVYGGAREVWRSPTEHRFVFDDPRDQRRFEKFQHEVARTSNRVPNRSGDSTVVPRLNDASSIFPPPLVWLLLGLVAFALRRPRRWELVLALCAAAFAIVLATAAVAPPVGEYIAPVSPAFILLAASGLVGVPVRGRRSTRLPGVSPRAAAIGGAATGVAAAGWALKLYVSRLYDAASGGQAPHDLGVFLHAAGKLVHGSSPYTYRGDETYAYPPLLGYLAIPLHAMGESAATFVWLLLSLAAIALALWWLGLRDWRCYALTAVFPFTRSAVDLGTVAPFLLLAVAGLWHWRDRIVPSAVAGATAIALKVYLWPLVVWLAATRRLRAAAWAAACTIVLVLVPWAVTGFAGLGHYPGLLRHLSRDEASSSYSVVALVVRAHLPEVVGVVVSVLIALALLAGAAWLARTERIEPRDRDAVTLTLVLAAALAASPIVWIHYFLLLLVPLALMRPRLSVLWFVPLAYYPLGETAWPTGDARKLGLALLTTLVLVAGTIGRDVYAARPSTE